MNYPGADIKCVERVSSASECQQLCKQTDKCAKFSYLTDDFLDASARGRCCLKTDKVIAPEEIMGVISGSSECGNLCLIHYWHGILYSKFYLKWTVVGPNVFPL